MARAMKRRLRRAWNALTSTPNESSGQPPAAAITAPSVELFQLRGCRELLEEHPDSLPIRSAIDVIERSIPSDPGLTYTHCRGLLETVCKTILADRGVATDQNAKPNYLMSQTLKVLKLTPDDFDGDDRVEDGVGDVLRGLNQLTNGIVALRKSQGVGPHGKDALEAVLDADYAIITANAVDAAAALLYRLHRKHAQIDPLKRIRFGDFPAFDAYLDDAYPHLVVEDTPLQASKAFCLLDPEAYRQRLMIFLESEIETDEDAGFAEGEQLEEGVDG